MSAERSVVVKTFMKIVQIDSPTFHEEKMAKEVFVRLVSLGLTPESTRALLEEAKKLLYS